MKTQSTLEPVNTALTPFEAQILALIASRKGEQVGEGEVMAAMFPAPKYPEGAKSGDAASNEWLRVERLWSDRAYSGNGVEYRDCYASRCARALIHLINAGLIREHNNGYNVGSYSIAS